MKPSVLAKSMGLKSLVQVSEMSGVGESTLQTWAKTKPLLLRIIIEWCAFELKRIEGK